MKYFFTLLDVMSHAWLMRIRKTITFLWKKFEKTGILCNNEKTRLDRSEFLFICSSPRIYGYLKK